VEDSRFKQSIRASTRSSKVPEHASEPHDSGVGKVSESTSRHSWRHKGKGKEPKNKKGGDKKDDDDDGKRSNDDGPKLSQELPSKGKIEEETVRVFVAASISEETKEIIDQCVLPFRRMPYPEDSKSDHESVTFPNEKVASNASDEGAEAKGNASGRKGRKKKKKVKSGFKINWVPRENFHITLRFIGNIPVSQISALADRLSALISIEGRTASRIRLQARGAGAFPQSKKQAPRILYAAVTEEKPESLPGHWTLSEIKQAVDYAVDGFLGTLPNSSNTAFTPHITLARCNAGGESGKEPDPIATTFLEKYAPPPSASLREASRQDMDTGNAPPVTVTGLAQELLAPWFHLRSIILFRSDTGTATGATDSGVTDFAGRSGSVYTPIRTFELS
jgi:2'-5' RNA ligase